MKFERTRLFGPKDNPGRCGRLVGRKGLFANGYRMLELRVQIADLRPGQENVCLGEMTRYRAGPSRPFRDDWGVWHDYFYIIE